MVDLFERIGGTVDVTVSQASLYCCVTDQASVNIYPFNLWPDRVYINYAYLKNRPNLTDVVVRQNFHEQFVAALGSMNGSNLDGQPSVLLTAFSDPSRREAFECVAKNLIAEALEVN